MVRANGGAHLSLPTGAVHTAELGAISEALLIHVGKPTELSRMMLHRPISKEASVEQTLSLNAALTSVSVLNQLSIPAFLPNAAAMHSCCKL